MPTKSPKKKPVAEGGNSAKVASAAGKAKKAEASKRRTNSSSLPTFLLLGGGIAALSAFLLSSEAGRGLLISFFKLPETGNDELIEEALPVAQWLKDEEYLRLSEDIGCDFPIVEVKDLSRKRLHEFAGMFEQPFVIRGGMKSWPANERWAKNNFTKYYGERIVKLGSESSIVYGGGTAGLQSTLNDIIENMGASDKEDVVDSFTFDVSVLRSIPEMGRDFRVPPLFQDWDNNERNKDGTTWHMLSLGAARTGLPFHVHGETWLGLVHGIKRWFIYPPGASAPLEIEQRLNPLRTVDDWFKEIYPKLSHLEKPSLEEIPVPQQDVSAGYRPLECIQQPGDIMYLPAFWNHLTLNIGEAIGIGGQTVLPAAKRLQLSLAALKNSPGNFEALKGAGLSYGHLAVEEEQRVLTNILATANGMTQLKPDNFEPVVLEGEDTWLVHFYNGGGEKEEGNLKRVMSDEEKRVSKMWNQLAGTLSGVVSVGAFDVAGDEAQANRYGFTLEQLTSNGPQIILFPGTCAAAHKELTPAQIDPQINPQTACTVGQPGRGNPIGYAGKLEQDDLEQFAYQAMRATDSEGYSLPRGSVTTVGVKARRLLTDAEIMLRRALKVQPLQPEARGLLGEMLGHKGDKKAMVEAVTEAEDLFDTIDPSHMSIHARASMYHKLATTLMTTKDLNKEAIKLMNKALSISPNYAPALVDKIVAHYMMGNRTAAEEVLFQLEAVAPKHSALPAIKQQLYGELFNAVQGKIIPGSGGGGAGRRSPPGNSRRGRPPGKGQPGVPIKPKPGGGFGSVGNIENFGQDGVQWKNNRMMKRAPSSQQQQKEGEKEGEEVEV